jgi:hypothetical protein
MCVYNVCVCVCACVCIGRSTAVTWESLEALGDADKQAEFVACMRADAIVRDCEAVRKTLLGPGTKWSALGQSFGGFCIMSYLSLAPEGLKQAMLLQKETLSLCVYIYNVCLCV